MAHYEVKRKLGGHLVGLKHDPSPGEVVSLSKTPPTFLLGRFLVLHAKTRRSEPDFAAIARGANIDALRALCNENSVPKGTKAEMVENLWRGGVDVEAALAADKKDGDA